jgi:hypothetical protein
MKVSTSSFLEGVALVAGQTDIGSTASLKRDAKALARTCSLPQFEATEKFGGIVAPIILANRWLTFRKDIPNDRLQTEVILSGGFESDAVPNLDVHIEGINRAAKTFTDKKMAGVLSGALVGLQTLDLVTPKALELEWAQVLPEYKRYMAIYDANGVPRNAARELFIYELVDSLSRITGFSFSSHEPRWGSLNVLTDPGAASVFVDNEEWGKSPVGMAVREGDHDVLAKKGKLQSSEIVTVEPARHREVSLSLR